jgi:hypothetical protein
MKSRNTVLLLLVLIVLGAAAYFISRKSSHSTLNPEASAFTVTDTAAVDRIFISSKSGWSHTLDRKKGSDWTLDGKFEARKDMVDMLLSTMRRMEVKRPADKSSRNIVIRDFAAMGRKVEIYQNGQLSKTFYVGETTDNDTGTYFIMEGSEDPYVLHIPGFQGFINSRFDINEKNWRSVAVFRSNAASIKELQISYPQSPAESFKIEKAADGNTFKVAGETLTAPENENLKAYLDNYKFVNGEFYLPNPQHRVSDSLMLQRSVAVVSLKDADPAKDRKLALYAKKGDPSHLIALNEQTKEVISVQTYIFDRLLLKKEAFRKK